MGREVEKQVQETILKLENAINNQTELDRLWCEVKCLLMNELDSLPDLPTSNSKKQKNKFRKSQPFWNENLTLVSLEGCL